MRPLDRSVELLRRSDELRARSVRMHAATAAGGNTVTATRRVMLASHAAGADGQAGRVSR